VPPTEKRGRVQTSTITVAVLPVPDQSRIRIDPNDLEIKTTKGSGPGGQNRNKTETAVQMHHRPSGITAYCCTERSQLQNKAFALEVLRSRLQEQADSSAADQRNTQRRGQVGSGMRGDKIRTIAIQRDQVTDHITGREMRAKAYLRGELEVLVG
jgi:peptide chain release factor 1